MRSTAVRLLVGALVAAALLQVALALPRALRLADTLTAGRWLYFTIYAITTVTALGASALAGLLLWKAPHKPDGRVLALFLAFLGIFWGSLFRFVNIEVAADQLSIDLNYGAGWASRMAQVSWILAVAAFVRFSALFPRPLTADRLPPPRRLRGLRRLRLATLSPWFVWGCAAAVILSAEHVPDLLVRLLGISEEAQPSPETAARLGMMYLGLLVVIYLVIPLLGIGIGARNLRASYRAASGDARRRMMWVVTGFSLAAWLLLGGLAATVPLGAMESGTTVAVGMLVLLVLAPLLIVLGCAMGVLYAGAIDPALALRRGTVYSAVGALGLIAFAVIETALSALLEQRLGLPGFAGPLIAGVVVALALIPIQRAVSRGVSRRMRTPADDALER